MSGSSLLAATLISVTILGAASSSETAPVVVELFTSEGCSSCPPADALLSRIARSGSNLIVLSEHVDYWDHLGWRDPFSSSIFSARQQDFGWRLKLESVYTPQMVVDGVTQFNGSDGEAAHNAINAAARQPKATVAIHRGKAEDGYTVLSVRVEHLDEAKISEADVILAVTEDNLTSAVHHGENGGRTLSHTGVVRSMTRVASIESKRGAYAADLQVNIAKSWKRENLKAVILIQDRKTKRISGAGSCTL